MVLDLMGTSSATAMIAVLQVIRPQGMLDGTQTEQLLTQVKGMLAEGSNIILIDLAETTFVDSSGIGGLVAALKQVRVAGRRMCLCSPNAQVRMVFELSSMDQVFEIYDNRAAFDQACL